MVFNKTVVLYVRIDTDIKERLEKLAEVNDRSLTSMTSIVLRKGLGLPDKKITFKTEESI